jgi:hypothetical protein
MKSDNAFRVMRCLIALVFERVPVKVIDVSGPSLFVPSVLRERQTSRNLHQLDQDAGTGAARTTMALKRRDVILAAVAVFIAWGYLTH